MYIVCGYPSTMHAELYLLVQIVSGSQPCTMYRSAEDTKCIFFSAIDNGTIGENKVRIVVRNYDAKNSDELTLRVGTRVIGESLYTLYL